MASFLEELQQEHEKDGLFHSSEISVSYPLGFPILDQQLGAIYVRRLPDGTEYRDIQLGIPAGTFTIFSGQTSSGKTAAAVKAACNIVLPFGELSSVIHRDGEKSTGYPRVQALSGWTADMIKRSYVIERDNCTWENVLTEIVSVAQKKEAAGDLYKYNSGHYDIWGKEYVHYVPTVIIVDSLSKFMSQNEATDMINGLMSSGRGTIYTGMFFRNALEYMNKYNINVFIINHMDDAMPTPQGHQKPKQFTFMPNGKYMGGGHKSKLLTSSILYFQPLTTKDDIHTAEVHGWNGVPTMISVLKSRTSIGGFAAKLEFIQETGFDERLSLMNFAKEKGLILGRNPRCYFEAMPDVKFDTRIFLKELNSNQEIERALFAGCKHPLQELIPVIDLDADDNLASANTRARVRDLMAEMYGV